MFYRMTCSVYGALGVYYSDRKMAPSSSLSLLLCIMFPQKDLLITYISNSI